MDDTSDLDRSARTTSEVGGSSDSRSDSERFREGRSASSTDDRAGDSSSATLPLHPNERVDNGGSDGRGANIGGAGSDDEEEHDEEHHEEYDEEHDEDDNPRDGESDADSVAASDESDGSDYDEPLTVLGSYFVFWGLLYELLFEDDDDDDDD